MLLIGSCGETPPQDPAAARGRAAYLSHCITCHNPDPSKPGPAGPEIKGSSRELIEARVLRADYPPGYRPKRDTHIMPARPDLVSRIDELAAFLR